MKYSKVFHPIVTEYGPFDLFVCNGCGSILTFPLPSQKKISEFYEQFQNGMPVELRNARESSPQTAIYQAYVERVCKLIELEEFSWLEIGSGGGEFASLMSKSKPLSKGVCLDFHLRPLTLESANVTWKQVDLNQDLATIIGEFDVVVSFAVLEHVLDPLSFVANFVRLIKKDGKGIIVCPNYSSFASKVLGRRWPYFSPGEHLTMPSLKGASCIMGQLSDCDFKVKSLSMPYSISYMAEVLGQKKISSVIPSDWTFPFPTGALSIEIYKK